MENRRHKLTDLEKIELACRRLAEDLGKGVGGFEQSRLLERLADQIAKDEDDRQSERRSNPPRLFFNE